jgi:hypothetical protein
MVSVEDKIYDKIGELDSMCQKILMKSKIESYNVVDEVMNPLWDDIFTEIHNNIQTNLHNAEY